MELFGDLSVGSGGAGHDPHRRAGPRRLPRLTAGGGRAGLGEQRPDRRTSQAGPAQCVPQQLGLGAHCCCGGEVGQVSGLRAEQGVATVAGHQVADAEGGEHTEFGVESGDRDRRGRRLIGRRDQLTHLPVGQVTVVERAEQVCQRPGPPGQPDVGVVDRGAGVDEIATRDDAGRVHRDRQNGAGHVLAASVAMLGQQHRQRRRVHPTGAVRRHRGAGRAGTFGDPGDRVLQRLPKLVSRPVGHGAGGGERGDRDSRRGDGQPYAGWHRGDPGERRPVPGPVFGPGITVVSGV